MHLDCTFIIFDCGTALRVGIRHRATQTLFLSELVDLVTSETPTSGKLFAGLHLAATHDALKRLPLLKNGSNKRARETEQYHLPYKRRRTIKSQENAEVVRIVIPTSRDHIQHPLSRKHSSTYKSRRSSRCTSATDMIRPRLSSFPPILLRSLVQSIALKTTSNCFLMSD